MLYIIKDLTAEDYGWYYNNQKDPPRKSHGWKDTIINLLTLKSSPTLLEDVVEYTTQMLVDYEGHICKIHTQINIPIEHLDNLAELYPELAI